MKLAPTDPLALRHTTAVHCGELAQLAEINRSWRGRESPPAVASRNEPGVDLAAEGQRRARRWLGRGTVAETVSRLGGPPRLDWKVTRIVR
jgi:hypothetical protein